MSDIDQDPDRDRALVPFTEGDLDLVKDLADEVQDVGEDDFDLLYGDERGGDVGEPAEHGENEGEAAEDGSQPISADFEPPRVEGVDWDKAALEPLLAIARRHGVAEDTATAVLSEYGRQTTNLVKQRAATDADERAALFEELRDTWGPAFAENRDHARAVLKTLPGEFRKLLQSARVYDGLGGLLVHQPAFTQLLSELGRLRAQRDAPRSGSSRLAQINEILATDPDRYWRLDLGKEKQRLLAQGHR
jgi:hypothetical protein